VIGKLTLKEKTDDQITVSWAKVGPSSTTSYQVFVKGDSDKDFENNGEVKENSFSLKTTLGGRKYEIKVRAVNTCGPGLYSPV